MNWHTHYNIQGTHAILSPSKYHWINYTPERLAEVYANKQRVVMGTKLHNLAETLIQLSVRLPQNNMTLNAFVNDAIGFRMSPEQMLFGTEFSYGTADAVCFYDNTLRIHDLKTGVSPGHMSQLEVYAALFCLEYDKKPNDIKIILRIYQDDQITEWSPENEDLMRIMGVIRSHSMSLKALEEEGNG